MRRRDFVTMLGGAAAAWPLTVRAKPAAKPIIGFLNSASTSKWAQLFRSAMEAAGWSEGDNITVDYRNGAGDRAKIDAAAIDLIASAPDLIYAIGLPAAQSVQARTRTIPIVFTRVADPIGFGLVSSLNHPGGNITGFTVWDSSVGSKWLQLLLQIAPGLRRVGILYNPETGPYALPIIESAKSAAGQKVTLIDCAVHTAKDLDDAISSLGREPQSGLLTIPEPFNNAHSEQIATQAARHSLPTMMPFDGATKLGALISYFYSADWSIQAPISYIDRILKGQAAGELPVQAPTKYQLSINLKTAKALGLDVPSGLLSIADEVIE